MINNNAMEAIDSLFVDILETRLHPEGYGWLCEQGAALRETARPGQLSRIFAQVPRFAIKADPELAAQQLAHTDTRHDDIRKSDEPIYCQSAARKSRLIEEYQSEIGA